MAQEGDSASASIGWASMAALVAGGMVGGGIYVALGVVVEAAGKWAWLSFVIAGSIAVLTAHSYGRLSNHFETGGGAFAFLERMDRRGAAGSLSWLLLGAYTLTIALYAFAFGEYVAHAFGAGSLVTRSLTVLVLIALTILNLGGIGKLTAVEVVIVSINLLVLLLLAGVGAGDWTPGELSPSGESKAVTAALMGAAAIFVSYEGFQLLTYEYSELEQPKRYLTPVLILGSLFVVFIYSAVAVGATMIAGADTVIGQATVALSVAAEQAVGPAGLVVMTVAAAFATSAAINSTLFSSAKLAERVAADGELPAALDHTNRRGVPDRPILIIAGLAGTLAMVGSLSSLVEAASLAFLTAFLAVNVVAWKEGVGSRLICGAALAISSVVGVALLYRLATEKPIPLALMLAFFTFCFMVRPRLLARAETEAPS